MPKQTETKPEILAIANTSLPQDYTELDPILDKVFRKYRLVSKWREKNNGREIEREGYTEVNLRKSRSASGEPLGRGLLLSMQCLNTFVAADKTDTKWWLDWMLFQVGGGKEGQRRSEQAMESTRERFLDERVRGFRDRAGVYHDPVTESEAKLRWTKNESRYLEVLAIGDQDMVEKLQVFGFHRNWPGPGGSYEKAVGAVTKFLKMRRMFRAMNAFYRHETGTESANMGLTPDDYSSVDTLDAAIKKVERFFNSRLARKDTRIQVIYEDENLTCLCPLTYASAVRYGWDAWPWANRATFEERLLDKNGSNWNDPWIKLTKTDSMIPIYFIFKVAMPSWITFENSKLSRSSFQNLALTVKASLLRTFDIREEKVYDEENRSILTINDVLLQIEQEPFRTYDPAAEEYPIHQGPSVYADAAEATRVSTSLLRACTAASQWASRFRQNQIVSNYLQEAA